MRVHSLCVVIATALLASCATHPSARPTDTRPRAGGAIDQLDREWRDERGEIPRDAFARAYSQAERLRAQRDVSATVAGISRNSWQWVGPGNIGCRIASLHLAANGTFFAASVGGGLWKTTNGGDSWAPVDDFLAALSTTAIISNPRNSNEMYAGTGEGFGNAGAIRGAGVFKSTDGGTTWSPLATTNTNDWLAVNWLTIASDGSALLAATTGAGGGSGGIWRSTDGGATWTKVADGADIGHVEFHPSDLAKAIASTRTGQALYSTDGGVSWNASESITSTKRVQVAYAKSNPAIVYASLDENGGQLFKSSDGGITYTLVNKDSRFLGDQGWLHHAIWIDPTDPNTVVVGGLDLWRSRDGGPTLQKISQWQKSPESAHGDQKVIVSSPGFNGGSDKTLYVGNDGGVYRTTDIYAVEPLGGWQPLNKNLGCTQFYGIAGNAASGVLVGGTQDNGTLRYKGDAQAWTPMYGGDGGYVAADPTDANVFYGEYVNLTIHRSEDGANWKADEIYGYYNSWNGERWEKLPRANPITEARSGTANFIAPFVLDQNEPNRLYGGARSLWVTSNVKKPNNEGGPDWKAIKSPIGESSAHNITAIAVATGDSHQVWVGHGTGALFRTTNALASTPSWAQLGSGTLPTRTALSIAVDPRNSSNAYASFGGFSASNIWKTTDGGASWQPAAAGLPAVPIRSVIVHPANSSWVYAGTEIGIFASEDGGTTWKVPHDGPANVAVRQLIFLGNDLVTATFGRGVYRATTSSPTSSAMSDCYSLTLDVAGKGAVRRDVEPNCNEQSGYRPGTVVTLRARGKEWTVTMDQDQRVTIPLQECYSLGLTVVPPAAGRIEVDRDPDCGTQYHADTQIVLRAFPATGFAFGGWDGDASGSEPVETIEMDGDRRIVAIFAVPATNDDRANAIDLTPNLSASGIFSLLEDTSNATNSASDPLTCEGGKGGKTVWFRFVPPSDGFLDLDTDGSNYDTGLAVWAVGPGGSLVSAGCDDDSDNEVKADDGGEVEFEDLLSEEQLSYITLGVTGGTTYLIEVVDATEPEGLPQQDYTRGEDTADQPEGGLLALHAQFSKGPGKRRGVRH